MPLVTQKWYFREDARRNRHPDTMNLDDALRNLDALYVFGDNVRRYGRGGQAKEMRDEPNAVGVATLYAPGDFFGNTPEEVLAQNRIIDRDMKPLFRHLVNGGVVVWPADGIGTGLAHLQDYAPDTFAYLETKIAALYRVSQLFKGGDLPAAANLVLTHEARGDDGA